jgi:DUF971 family protein
MASAAAARRWKERRRMNEGAWPTELRSMQGGRVLRATFDDGRVFDLSAEYLRVESPSAEVRGHAANERRIESGKANVAIREIAPTGNYAVRLIFDDGHSTGIYTWLYLHELGRDYDRRWAAYLHALADKGLSR